MRAIVDLVLGVETGLCLVLSPRDVAEPGDVGRWREANREPPGLRSCVIQVTSTTFRFQVVGGMPAVERGERSVKRIVAAAAVALMVAGGVAAPAQAKPTYDPEKEKPATPGQACRAIQNVIDALAPDAGIEFSVGECASALAKRDFTFSFFGTPVQEQCAVLQGFGIEWPYTFYEQETGTIDDLLPELTARNDKECTHALYTYHTIVTLVPEPPA